MVSAKTSAREVELRVKGGSEAEPDTDVASSGVDAVEVHASP